MLATNSILSREACPAQPVTHPTGENERVCSNRGSGRPLLSTSRRHRSAPAPRASPWEGSDAPRNSGTKPVHVPLVHDLFSCWYDPWHLCLRSRRQHRYLDVAHKQTHPVTEHRHSGNGQFSPPEAQPEGLDARQRTPLDHPVSAKAVCKWTTGSGVPAQLLA